METQHLLYIKAICDNVFSLSLYCINDQMQLFLFVKRETTNTDNPKICKIEM